MRTASGRYSAAALAALCLLAPVLGYAHLVLVQHTRCSEHGELVHVRSADVAEAPAGVGSDIIGGSDSEGGVPARALRDARDTESHEHDHCAAVAARKTQAPLVSVGAIMPATPSVLWHWVNRDVTVHAPIPLYQLAPKNSPPA